MPYRLANASTLRGVSSFTHLQRLVVRGCRELTDDAVKPIVDCAELRELDLSFCALLTPKSCLGLSSSPTAQSLRSLSMVSLELLTDAALHYLARLSLTSLDVSQCDQLTDRGLHHLTTGPCALTLTTLHLSWLPNITGAALLDFADLRTGSRPRGRTGTTCGTTWERRRGRRERRRRRSWRRMRMGWWM